MATFSEPHHPSLTAMDGASGALSSRLISTIQNQYIRDGHFLPPEKFKKAQDEKSAVRNSTFFSALKRSSVMPEEQLLSLAM